MKKPGLSYSNANRELSYKELRHTRVPVPQLRHVLVAHTGATLQDCKASIIELAEKVGFNENTELAEKTGFKLNHLRYSKNEKAWALLLQCKSGTVL
jgi:hypothetical protein